MANLDCIDRVVIPKLDRLGRSASHLNKLFDEFAAAEVELVSIRDDFDSATSNGRLMRGLLTLLAEFEGDLISERVKSTASVQSRARRQAPRTRSIRVSLFERHAGRASRRGGGGAANVR